MTMNARIIPVSSKQDVLDFVEEIKTYPNSSDRDDFVALFKGAFENWYFQEVDGRCFIIAITEGNAEDIQSAFNQYKDLKQPFFDWFCDRILTITGVNMRVVPGGDGSEHIFEFGS